MAMTSKYEKRFFDRYGRGDLSKLAVDSGRCRIHPTSNAMGHSIFVSHEQASEHGAMSPRS
jgi:hypothetical protein